MFRFAGRRTLGIAIGSTAVHGFGIGSQAAAWSRSIEPLSGDGSWTSLTEALRRLRTEYPAARTLSVALLAPLVDVRPLTLPPLSAAEARQVLTRNAARYFVGAREPQVIGLELPPRRMGAGRPIIAAAASARLIEAVHAAAHDAQWEIETIVPAEAAWRAAALAVWPSLRRGTHDVVAPRAGRTDVLYLDNGVLMGVRRFGDAADGLALSSAAGEDAASSRGRDELAVFGARPLREAITRARSGSERVLAPATKWEALAESPESLAAAFSRERTGLELVAASVWRKRGVRRKQLTTMVASAAIVMFGVAAVLEWWGLRRELDYVRHERLALHPQVATLIATRDSAALTDQRLQDLAAERGAALPWSKTLLTLMRALPLDAHLTAFRADGDSLVVEGLAAQAGDVFAAIDATPGFVNVRSAAPVRRDLGDRQATDVAEHFSVAVRIVPSEDTVQIAAAQRSQSSDASVVAPAVARP